MPYLICVGRIAENDCGEGSRGYHVWREGKIVYREWGPIVQRRHDRRPVWLWDGGRPHKEEEDRYRTEEAAAEAMAKKKRELLTAKQARPAYRPISRIYRR